MLEQLSAARSIDSESLYIRSLLSDVGDNTDVWDQDVLILIVITIAHLLIPSLIIFCKGLDDLHDVQRLRTLLNAAAAAYAHEHTVVICRIVYEFVHKSLAETL